MKDTPPPCPLCGKPSERKFSPFCSAECSDADLDRVRGELVAGLETLAETLLGTASIRKKRTLRWGKKGSLSLEISGRKRGSWHDHEAGTGGGPLQLIQHAQSCSMADAIRWARNWTGGTPDAGAAFKADHAARQAERDREARAAAVEQAIEERQRTGYAARLWAGSKPIAGTVAERYLVEARGIPTPPAWPDAIRFHKPTRSLIVAATADDGTLRAVQRVRLTPEARKAEGTPDEPTKQTNGVLAGAAARLPGDPAGPLLLAEGPETGLSLWSATGYETWIVLGGMGGITPPAGRRTVACRDDDARHSPADRRLLKTVAGWTATAHQVATATPWPFRLYDKTDFNDTLREDSPAAVRQRIKAALNPGGGAPTRLPIKLVRERLRAAEEAFFNAVREWDARQGAAAALAMPNQGTQPTGPAEQMVMPIHAIRVDLGSGKTLTAIQQAIRRLAEMRAAGDMRSAAFAISTHALGDEVAAIFAVHAAKTGLTAAVWRGMSAPDPDSLGDPMCRNLEAVQDARDAMLEVQPTTCRRKLDSGEYATCPFFNSCGYQKQRKSHADLWIVPHEMIFLQKPTAIGKLAFLVVDESIWQDGLDGVHGRPTALSLDSLGRVQPSSLDAGMHQHLDRDRLEYLRNRLLDVLRPLADGPVSAEAVEMSDLTLDNVREAYRLEWRRFVDPGMHPGMTKTQRREAVHQAAVNATIPRLASVWEAVAALLEDGGPQRSGWAALAVQPTDDGPMRVLHLKGRRKVRKGWQVPTLLMDATMNVELVRPYWPDVRLTAELLADAPYQTVRQIVDRAYSKSAIEPLTVDTPGYTAEEAKRRHRGLRSVHAVLNREARQYGGAPVLVVTQKAIREALPAHGPMAACIDLAHHNAVAGRDLWRNVRALIVVGRTQPAPASVERLAEALTGRVVEHVEGWYARGDGVRHMAGAGAVAIEADRHPDPIVEAVRWQVCEAELLQIIGRGRGVNRTEDDPLDVLVLTDAPLPLPVAATLQAADLAPSPADLMLAAGGVVFENATDVAAAYPQLWTNREAAKKALQRASEAGQLGTFSYESLLLGECPQLERVSYQRAGARLSPSVAWCDPGLVPDPATWLAQRIGPLAWCRVDGHQPDPPPSPSATADRRPRPQPPDISAGPVPAWADDPGWSPADAERFTSDRGEPDYAEWDGPPAAAGFWVTRTERRQNETHGSGAAEGCLSCGRVWGQLCPDPAAVAERVLGRAGGREEAKSHFPGPIAERDKWT